MLILNTFISEETVVPEYTETSIKQTRKENPEIPILFICKQEQPWFKDLKVQWVSQDSLSKGTWLTKFNKVCKFNRHGTPQNTTHPSPKNFWHRTAERIFYLREAINSYKLDNVFHFENDVMVYDSFDKIVNKLPNNIVSAIPMSQTHSTFALTFIPTIDSIDFMCEYFLNLLHKGERHLQRKGYDHISEMSLLNMAMRNGYAEQLPILPSRDLSNSVDLIFDPGSYGQFLGGTNNGHPSGFIDPTHFIGQYFGRTEDRPERPFDDGHPYFQGSKIFNLHIHSKNLKDFYND